MGGKLVATDAGIATFAKQMDAMVQDMLSNPDIVQLGVLAKGTTTAHVGAPYHALLVGNGGTFAPATTLQTQFQNFCTAVSGTFTGMQTSLTTIRADLENAGTILHNADTDAITTAQMLSLLSNVLGGGNPPVAPPK